MINTSNARLHHIVPIIPFGTQLPMNSLACTQALDTLRASFMFELSAQGKKKSTKLTIKSAWIMFCMSLHEQGKPPDLE